MSVSGAAPISAVGIPPAGVAGVMEAEGFYNRYSQVQAAGIALALPALTRAAEAAHLDRAPVVIADYGCAQGRNAIQPMAAAMRALRRRMGAERPVVVAHIDRPENDFNTLFQVLASDPDGYAHRDPDCFPVAIGRSFFGPVLPAGSVTLGWSSYAAHWLSALPVAVPGHLYPRLTPPEQRAAFERQGHSDWLAFLVARCDELRRGGRLVVVMPATPETWSGVSDSAYRQFMDGADAELRCMVAEGAITEAERARMVVPVFGRTLPELVAPLATDLLDHASLVEHAVVAQPDPYWAQFRRDGDIDALAEGYAGFFRAVFMPSLRRALDPGRGEAGGAAFTERLSAGLRRLVRAAPRCVIDYALATLVVARH